MSLYKAYFTPTDVDPTGTESIYPEVLPNRVPCRACCCCPKGIIVNIDGKREPLEDDNGGLSPRFNLKVTITYDIIVQYHKADIVGMGIQGQDDLACRLQFAEYVVKGSLNPRGYKEGEWNKATGVDPKVFDP